MFKTKWAMKFSSFNVYFILRHGPALKDKQYLPTSAFDNFLTSYEYQHQNRKNQPQSLPMQLQGNSLSSTRWTDLCKLEEWSWVLLEVLDVKHGLRVWQVRVLDSESRVNSIPGPEVRDAARDRHLNRTQKKQVLQDIISLKPLFLVKHLH